MSINYYEGFLFFIVFDPKTFEMIYTMYNFDFDKYILDFNIKSIDKIFIFTDFLKRNNTTFDKPYTVNIELVPYFTKITNEIINYILKYAYTQKISYISIIGLPSFIRYDILLLQQFDLVYYTDDQIQRVQDYYYTENNFDFTKYNFDFDKYSIDFNVYGNKLVIFTDFVIRCSPLSGTFYGFLGYGLPDIFKKYFIKDDTIINYMINNECTSVYNNIYKNVYNIDFLAYGQDNKDLNIFDENIELLKEHYFRYGQFEKRIITFITKPQNSIEKIYSSIATIFTKTENGNPLIGTGFLYNNQYGNSDIYLITCHHYIKNSFNKNTIRASFETKNNNSQIIQTMTADFLITGYDIYADILVALYDPKLPYNVKNNVDITPYKPLYIDAFANFQKGNNVSIVGNIGFINNESFLEGTIIDPSYNGDFSQQILPIPDTILMQIHSSCEFAGSPILLGDPMGSNDLKIIGMVNGNINNYKQYTTGINGFILKIIIENILNYWHGISVIYANNSSVLNYYLKNGLKKRWLGIISSYYHPILSIQKFNSLTNFPYTGGLIIENFIMGFNFLTKKYITDLVELSEQSTIFINSPLLNTKLYNQYIVSGHQPIVIKSLIYFDGLRSIYNKFYLGKFSNQKSYSHFMYGMEPIANFQNLEQYTNTVVSYYPEIIIEYFYFNGIFWVLDSERIGGNNLDWFNIYSDPLGNLYYQHKFEFPASIVPYTNSYTESFSRK